MTFLFLPLLRFWECLKNIGRRLLQDWRLSVCSVKGHGWKQQGGRPCPWGYDNMCSQPVFVCARCGDIDYGTNESGPGKDWCHKNCSRYEDLDVTFYEGEKH